MWSINLFNFQTQALASVSLYLRNCVALAAQYDSVQDYTYQELHIW